MSLKFHQYTQRSLFNVGMKQIFGGSSKAQQSGDSLEVSIAPVRPLEYITITVKRADVELGHPTYETIIKMVLLTPSGLAEGIDGKVKVYKANTETYAISYEFKQYRSLFDIVCSE